MWPFKNIEKIKEKHQHELLSKNGVFGISVGTKVTDGIDTGKKAIIVFVNKKKDVTALAADDVVPEKIEGVPTDVIDLGGEIKPMHWQKHRPVLGGISAIVEGGTACTLGCVVFKDGVKVALTNDHCVSFNHQNNFGKKYLQQSPADGGSESIGKIISMPILRNDQVNKIDSAIVQLDVDSKVEVLNVTNYIKEWKDAFVGMKFFKSGRTTGVTQGTISHINATAKVNYGGSLGTCEFYPVIFALQSNYNIVNGGDSGSCVFSESGHLIGQVFAAAPNLAIILPIRSVIEELGISLKEKQAGFVALERTFITDKEVLINGLNFRSSPTISNNIIGKLYKGQAIEVIEYAGFDSGYHWIKIRA